MYYDTALSATPYALRSLQELADPSHILFGSDYPFAPDLVAGAMVKGIEDYEEFNVDARLAIERGNAARLFPEV